jgi:valyl-tRNA synthetase
MKEKEAGQQELPKAYDPKNVDVKWYDFWEKSGFFLADPNSSKPAYCIVMPPPNVTGVLHMGHGLVSAVQDVLIRWKRMKGYEALWVPGTDHAGIATQTVVERRLMKTLGKKRKDFSREEFLQHTWSWKEESEKRIVEQLKRVGCSCDWRRQRFTMDSGSNKAVRTMFKKLFDDGLIYRGDYLVNWDPVTQTALADDEVEYEERSSFLWHFKYPFKDGPGFIVIATTRPETMLGDTAIAVSPRDSRYAHLIGKTVLLPLMNREIPIIADHHVDPSFGTGMVKVTPAHDPNDYQMGHTHNLPFINIMTPDGRINSNGGKFEGMTFEEARSAVVKEMESLGLLEKKQPHQLRVGLSYRSKAVIEPYMSKQWFVKMEGFAKTLESIVKEGKTKLIPKNWENVYFHWISNLRDWCISRQLWWGHRIPIWYHKNDPERIICYDGEGEPPEIKQAPQDWIQDEDVLDTWFSSALWPFSTLGWPEVTPELKKFYPNSVLVTGDDILFFWVARMLLMGNYALGEPPFPETFLHGLIYAKSYWKEVQGGGISYVTEAERKAYDLGKPVPKEVISKWEKMSKSKGNVIDPIEIIEDYGTDAMRMALCASITHARQIDLDRRRFEEYKNFANKVWNGARFVFMNLETEDGQPLDLSSGLDESLLSLEDHWILSALNGVIRDANHYLASYSFDQYAQRAYDFFWKQFCAYYVEIAKPVLFGKIGTPELRRNKQKLLAILLDNAIRLLHPVAPFITEELFQQLKKRFGDIKQINAKCDPYTEATIRALNSPACIVAPFPEVIREKDLDPAIDHTFELMERVIYTIRNIRGEMQLPPTAATAIHIVGTKEDPNFALIEENHSIIPAMIRTTEFHTHTKEPVLGFSCTGVLDKIKIMIPMPEELLQQEKARLAKEEQKLVASLEKMRLQLDNSDFVSRAPAQLIEKNRAQLQQMEKELAEIQSKQSSL